MDTRIVAALAAGQGLVTSRQLRALGFAPLHLAALVRAGRLVAVKRGVYTSAEIWDSYDEFRGRPLARIRAVHLVTGVPHAFSHDSASHLLELPQVRPQDAEVHLSRRELRGTRTAAGLHQHGALYSEDEVELISGLPTLGHARTVMDMAREHGYDAGLVAADGAMQQGVGREQLRAASAAMWGWPHSLVTRRVVEDADPGAESAPETLTRILVKELALGPEVETQFPVRLRGRAAWCDLRVGRHLVEFDGRIKFRSTANGGVSDRDLEQVVWDERERQREVCAQEFGMSRLSYADLFGTARDRTKARIAAEFRITTARFGTELTAEQAAFAESMRGRRYKAAS